MLYVRCPFVFLVSYYYGLDCTILVLIVPVSVHCLSSDIKTSCGKEKGALLNVAARPVKRSVKNL